MNVLTPEYGNLDQMAPIRPSKLVWQLPYTDRKSFMDMGSIGSKDVLRLSKMLDTNHLKPEKQESVDSNFEKANMSDSDFEDDIIEDDEEFGGASRAVKLSIWALNFNMGLDAKINFEHQGQSSTESAQ